MKLVRLAAALLVNPQEVSSVYLPERSEHVVVAMRSGEKHFIAPDHDRSRWQEFDRIAKALADAPTDTEIVAKFKAQMLGKKKDAP